MQVLLPECVARQNGIGAEIAIEAGSGRHWLLTLDITRIVEQESLEVSIWGSPDKSSWKLLDVFPRKSYCGTYIQLLDLQNRPQIRFLRAEWKLSRWGGTEDVPLFEFSLCAEEAKLQAVGA